jgi:hypothetical protein
VKKNVRPKKRNSVRRQRKKPVRKRKNASESVSARRSVTASVAADRKKIVADGSMKTCYTTSIDDSRVISPIA